MQRRQKKELIRIVGTPRGELSIDKSFKMDGRGIYICKSEKCLDIAMRKKSIKRSLKLDADESFVVNLKDYINK